MGAEADTSSIPTIKKTLLLPNIDFVALRRIRRPGHSERVVAPHDGDSPFITADLVIGKSHSCEFLGSAMELLEDVFGEHKPDVQLRKPVFR